MGQNLVCRVKWTVAVEQHTDSHSKATQTGMHARTHKEAPALTNTQTPHIHRHVLTHAQTQIPTHANTTHNHAHTQTHAQTNKQTHALTQTLTRTYTQGTHKLYEISRLGPALSFSLVSVMLTDRLFQDFVAADGFDPGTVCAKISRLRTWHLNPLRRWPLCLVTTEVFHWKTNILRFADHVVQCVLKR